MRAMILAGGMSTRLYPLTHEVPKPLVPIAGEPVVAHTMRYLRSFGIEDVAINVHYHADMVRERLGDGSAYGVRLHYLYEEKLMGSAGAVKQMEGFFDDTFIVIGCDELTDANLDALVGFHRKRSALATIALVEMQDVEQYGVVILNDDGRITAFQEKPARGTERSHLVNTGIYVFEPEIMAHMPAGTFYDFGKELFPKLQAEDAAFYGLEMPGAYWCDIGTPQEYRRGTTDVLEGRVRLPGARARGIAPDTILGDDVRIEGDVRIGAGVRLGTRSRIVGPTVIGDRAVVGASAVIEGSILWDDVSIGDGAHVDESIVGIGYAVPAYARLANSIVANGNGNGKAHT